MKYFEKKLTCRDIHFCLSDTPWVEEREMHPYHEILFYMGERTELLTASGKIELDTNTLVIIPEETYHFFKLADKNKFPRLKISFTDSATNDTPLPELVSELRVIIPNEETESLLNRICTHMQEAENPSGFYVWSAFHLLVAEIDISNVENKNDSQNRNNITASLNEYITENLSSDLSISSVAKALHVSESGITHTFKRQFGIPFHKYVAEKRLLLARRLITSGAKPTKIYCDVGFGDYSSFYKAYVSFFGYPPSDTVK